MTVLGNFASSAWLTATLWAASLAAAGYVTARTVRQRHNHEPDRPRRHTGTHLAMALGGLVIAGIGFAISFESVSATAHGWAQCDPSGTVCTGSAVWQHWPWALPLGIDSSIIILDGLDLGLVRLRKELAWLRLVPRGMVAVTIFLNVLSATTWGDRVAHAALIFNYAVVAHVLRHAIETEENGGRTARVDAWQWVLAPRAAYWTWRTMRLQRVSWEAATAADHQRALTRFWLIEHYRKEWKPPAGRCARVAAGLRAVWTRGWSRVPAELRVRFRLGDYEALGRVAKDIAARVAEGPGERGNGVAGAGNGGVAGSVAGRVSGVQPAVSGDGNGVGSGGTVVLLGRVETPDWMAAAETLAVSEPGNPDKVATARRVAGALCDAVAGGQREPSNAVLGGMVGLSHTSAGNYKKVLRRYLPGAADGVGEREAVGET
jgi:hypothetical protein